MKLKEYIKDYYSNNQRAFALDNGMTAQQVTPMLKKGYYHVIDGYLCTMKKKLKPVALIDALPTKDESK